MFQIVSHITNLWLKTKAILSKQLLNMHFAAAEVTSSVTNKDLTS